MSTETTVTTVAQAVVRQEDEEEPQRITLREVYTSVTSLRREMTARIQQVEDVGRSDRAAIRTEIELARANVARSEDIAASRMSGVENRMSHTDEAVARLGDALKPIVGWYADQKEEAQQRAAWRGRVSKFIFGSGLISFLTLLLALFAIIFGHGR